MTIVELICKTILSNFDHQEQDGLVMTYDHTHYEQIQDDKASIMNLVNNKDQNNFLMTMRLNYRNLKFEDR